MTEVWHGFHATLTCGPTFWWDTQATCFGGVDDLWLILLWAEIRKTHRAFIDRISPQNLEPNPLPILSRAVNAVRLRLPLRQPRWSTLRWRSTT